ncbi:hypothetical protein AnigIFM50267_001883 [Aspergillus niger]|nr:hypothetical protein AnigIFM50267_001883 [Aspergillus niger]
MGTIICSRSSNATTLLTGRTIQGLGAGGITNLSEVILTDLVPLQLRGRYLAILNSTWAIGSTSGPVIGAAFAQKVSWTSGVTSTTVALYSSQGALPAFSSPSLGAV